MASEELGKLLQQLGLGIAAEALVHLAQIVEGLSEVRVIGAQGLLTDGDTPPIQWLGLRVATLGLIKLCEIEQRLSYVEIIGAACADNMTIWQPAQFAVQGTSTDTWSGRLSFCQWSRPSPPRIVRGSYQ